MRCPSRCLLLLTLAGCAGAPPPVDALAELTAATDVADAVQFHSDAEPIDAAVLPAQLTLEQATAWR